MLVKTNRTIYNYTKNIFVDTACMMVGVGLVAAVYMLPHIVQEN